MLCPYTAVRIISEKVDKKVDGLFFGNIFINKLKVSFEIGFFWGFQICPYFRYLAK